MAEPETNTDLHKLALKHGTDKLKSLAAVYWNYLKDMRFQPVRLLEIGIYQGASLRMWREFFPDGKIYGVDINCLEVPGVSCFRVDQSRPEDLQWLIRRTGGRFDVIIDDGGHTMTQQRTSFLELFPQLNDNGLYFIEDTHTSYMPRFQDTAPSMTAFLKSFVDYITLRGSHLCDEGGYGSRRADPFFCEYSFASDIPVELVRNVNSIHFYPRLAVIAKKGKTFG